MNEQQKKDQELLKNWHAFENEHNHSTTLWNEDMSERFVINEMLAAQSRLSFEEGRKAGYKKGSQDAFKWAIWEIEKEIRTKCDVHASSLEALKTQLNKILSQSPNQSDNEENPL